MALMNAVQEALNRLGGSSIVARQLGVEATRLREWMTLCRMRSAPYEYVAKLAQLSGIPKEKLAPLDLAPTGLALRGPRTRSRAVASLHPC